MITQIKAPFKKQIFSVIETGATIEAVVALINDALTSTNNLQAYDISPVTLGGSDGHFFGFFDYYTPAINSSALNPVEVFASGVPSLVFKKMHLFYSVDPDAHTAITPMVSSRGGVNANTEIDCSQIQIFWTGSKWVAYFSYWEIFHNTAGQDPDLFTPLLPLPEEEL